MKKESLIVPNGIRYISDWKGYSLENYQFPHILNKTLTGCGYTEYCIRNPLNVILCSPRKILLENKADQHPKSIYYVRNDVENQTDFEKDFSSKNFPKVSSKISTWLQKLGVDEDEKKAKIMRLKQEVVDYYTSCQPSPFSPGKPCKILVTYDSFRHVKEALGENIKDFYVVIDEMQSIFTDAKFKSNTELEFVEHLKGLDRVCFVSATPMLTKYLDLLEYFQDLPYYELDWGTKESSRVIRPSINVKYCGKKNTIQSEIKKVIDKYRSGVYEVYRYEDENGLLQEVKSKEAVIYVNSVLDITKAIKGSKLTISECNVLCSKTTTNEDKIRKAFGGKKSDGIKYIGTVPKKDEPHKMFTFCTRTVYLGADFYSTNARSFIFSNANIDCLCVDISMDLPQILGRQRLNENPWKNCADLYVTLKYKEKNMQEFMDYMSKKEKATESLLRTYRGALEEDKDPLAGKYEFAVKHGNYKDDYVAVNHHAGSSKLPVFNRLMQVAELRAFEIQEIDYADRFTVLSRINENYNVSTNKDRIDATIRNFNYQYTNFIDKMKYLCSQKDNLTEEEYNVVLNQIPMEYKNYITTLGIEKIITLGCQKSKLDIEFKKLSTNQGLDNILENKVYSVFNIGEKYSKSEIKEKLREIYKDINYKSTPKANDLEKWFDVKEVLWRESGKMVAGFKIVKKKGD